MSNSATKQPSEQQLSALQGKLWPYAYAILGDSMGAEDVVQDILTKHFLGSYNHVENIQAYLTRAVINRSINEKALLRTRNEIYPGTWLPTPVRTEDPIDQQLDRPKVLNYALMVLLEKLQPRERAVFILKESFDYSHQEIATALNIEVDHSRQLLRRARAKLADRHGKQTPNLQLDQEALQQLTAAIINADMKAVEELLTTDVQCISDGGPNVSAARKVMKGKQSVFKFLRAIYGKYLPQKTIARSAVINHQPAVEFFLDGHLFRTLIASVDDHMIEHVFIVVNPDKLLKLDPPVSR